MNPHFLASTKLFHGLLADEVSGLLTCLGAYEKSYRKGTVILRAGTVTREAGLVEQGSVNIVVNSYWGSSSIFGHVGSGQLFAETYAAIPGKELLCDVVAAEDCTVLFLQIDKLLTTCSNSCSFHNRLIHNLIRIFATKSLGLSGRMMHISHKTIRERLLSYLSEQMMSQGDAHFTIPFSRQQLADYLGVDRTALSNELSKMQRDGLLTYQKNQFTLSFQAEDINL